MDVTEALADTCVRREEQRDISYLQKEKKRNTPSECIYFPPSRTRRN
jgi:hypothetical protein